MCRKLIMHVLKRKYTCEFVIKYACLQVYKHTIQWMCWHKNIHLNNLYSVCLCHPWIQLHNVCVEYTICKLISVSVKPLCKVTQTITKDCVSSEIYMSVSCLVCVIPSVGKTSIHDCVESKINMSVSCCSMLVRDAAITIINQCVEYQI